MIRDTPYRELSQKEIQQLTSQGCEAKDWSSIQVKPGFDATRVHRVQFSGEIKIGTLKGEIEFADAYTRPSGLRNATIHNCTIGDEVFISGIRNFLANYRIGDRVVIDNVQRIQTEGPSSFGNGKMIKVLNESGGREVPMFDRLSAHLAYIIALYRHQPKVIKQINGLIQNFANHKVSHMGHIGNDARICNAGVIRNVWIGQDTLIDGVEVLEEGSINSSRMDPVFVGRGVTARTFIFASGSRITDGALIADCFVGQGVHIGSQYSAENSLFFTNSAGFHGEAFSVFAGPYTVSHHKSTLLIAGYFSFLNAGSGSNQSNHMYKLGPMHQGIVERGSKTTSDSYLLWPSRIGAFTLVMGRHYKNSDTTNLPFSYLIESNDESILAPGVNLRSVGTVRDAQKWPKRDVRKDSDILDLINFNLLSPFTIQKMIKGRKILEDLRGSSGRHSDYYFYENCKIPKRALERGIRLYTAGIHKFLGNSLISRLDRTEVMSKHDLFVKLEPCHTFGDGEWVDLAGLIAPKRLVQDLLDRIDSEDIGTLNEISTEFAKWQTDYYEMEWTWTKKVLEDEFGLPISKYEPEDVIRIIETWKRAVVGLDEMLYKDARKEFTLSSQTGFGIDGGERTRKKDFNEVRGTFESYPAVAAIKDHIKKKSKLGDSWIEKLQAFS